MLPVGQLTRWVRTCPTGSKKLFLYRFALMPGDNFSPAQIFRLTRGGKICYNHPDRTSSQDDYGEKTTHRNPREFERCNS